MNSGEEQLRDGDCFCVPEEAREAGHLLSQGRLLQRARTARTQHGGDASLPRVLPAAALVRNASQSSAVERAVLLFLHLLISFRLSLLHYLLCDSKKLCDRAYKGDVILNRVVCVTCGNERNLVRILCY